MTHHESDSTFVSKGPCPSCGSSDANALYSDGHTYCFSCDEHVASAGADQEGTKRSTSVKGLLYDLDYRGLRTRKITDATCKHFGYGIGRYKGQDVHVAPYYDKNGRLVAQHLRTKDKNFPWLGNHKEAMPFGYHCFPKSGKMLVLTEGEIDALSMSQVQNNKWPVWSIGSGAGPQVKKYISARRDAFLHFDKVVIMFDMDDPGREAAQAVAEILGQRAHIASLPLKDASDMLVAGRVEELVQAMWRAVPYTPDGLVEVRALKSDVFKPIIQGLPWVWDGLTKMTFGRRTGEIYCFGAGTGTGKTDLFAEQIAFDLQGGMKIGAFLFEQQPSETALRITSKIGRKPFHIPQAQWTTEERENAWERLESSGGQLYLYDSFGMCDWDVVQERIRFLAHSEDVHHFYIDHLTALAAWQEDERKALEVIMAELGSLVKELDIAVYLISHLATPEGKPHEEGGRVMIRHFKGSRAIGFWCHFMFGLERDQQASDERMRRTTTFRCLKDRYTGRSVGDVIYLQYDPETAMLNELAKHQQPEQEFEDESQDEAMNTAASEDF